MPRFSTLQVNLSLVVMGWAGCLQVFLASYSKDLDKGLHRLQSSKGALFKARWNCQD